MPVHAPPSPRQGEEVPTDDTMLYHDQVPRFNQGAGAGVPAAAREAIADALADVVALERGQAWLEIGVGAGALSLALVRRPIRYIGFDRSTEMIAAFREALGEQGLRAALTVADGNARWPVASGSIAVVFSFRALHHLDSSHVVDELRRIGSPRGVWLALGGVRRPEESVTVVMRKRMRELLTDAGYAGKSAKAHAESVFSALERLGGCRAPARVAARWTRSHRPADSLAAWDSKAGLAGLEVPPHVKAGVLEKLGVWAEEFYGDLGKPVPQEEYFEIAAIHLATNG